ncbi:MAG TPA: nitroreductase family deazaflavin-dependent oxidoreductase [Roseiflexaceae bacterium]|jgi:deazaflavin-dependent oxidoreductase (nitroreductase family)|nr:nitroreductase family deazaflavin-dependent oxidoreductase [Roseiflexaceae bacterium]
MMHVDIQQYADDDFCYLTTTGRVTGRPHEIEIWFALHENTLYMLAGGREKSDWVKNIQKNPQVRVRLGGETFEGRARIVTDGDEDGLARRIVVAKYQPRDADDLTEWGRTSLAVAVDVDGRKQRA